MSFMYFAQHYASLISFLVAIPTFFMGLGLAQIDYRDGYQSYTNKTGAIGLTAGGLILAWVGAMLQAYFWRLCGITCRK